MARRVFFSFYYNQDGWRAAQVRNIGKLEADNPVSDNEWEQVKKGGDASIKKWIDRQMNGKTCCVVLVGAETSSRRWVRYEIEESWKAGRSVLGVRIHGLLDRAGKPSTAGPSPFQFVFGGVLLSSIVPLHAPAGSTSKEVYASIAANIEAWVEEAIRVRAKYRT